MKGIRFSSINCLRWGRTKETGSQMKACAIHSIRFTRMNCLWLGNTKETVSQIKVCAIYDMRFTRMNCLRWDKRTETVQYNKYHKYCKVQIQRLQCPNSNIANLVISAKGSAANKSCMGLTQWFPIALPYALPIQSLTFLEALPFRSTSRLW